MLRKVGLIAVCLTLAALCYSTAAPAPAKDVSSLAIVPAQCPIVVQLRGVDRVRDRIKATLTAANPTWGALATQKLEEVMTYIPDGRKLEGLAPNGPYYLAFLELPGGDQPIPQVAIIAKVTSYKAFRDGILNEDERKKLAKDPGGFESTEIADRPVFFLEKPDFAIMAFDKETIETMTKSYSGLNGKLTAELAEQFTERDITAYVNMATVNKAHGDDIRQMRDMLLAVMSMGAGNMDPSQVEMARKLYGGMFQVVLDSEVLVATTDFRPEGLAFQTYVRVGGDTVTNGVLKAQNAGVTEALGELPAGQMMYFGASGLSPEAMKAFLAMNAGMTKGPEGSGNALEELGEAKARSVFGAASYPLSGVSVQEYEDAPRAMKATVALLESLDEGGSYSGGFVKSKPEVKPAAQNHRDIAWTSYRIVWDFDKAAEAMPVGGDEMTEYMKKLLGEELHGWIGVSGNRLIQVTAKDWNAATVLIDSLFDPRKSVSDSAAFKSTRKELPQSASAIYLMDAGPMAFVMADSMLPLLRASGAPMSLPETLSPAKFVPAFGGASISLQPQQAGLDLFVPVAAVSEVSKIVNQFLMGAN